MLQPFLTLHNNESVSTTSQVADCDENVCLW